MENPASGGGTVAKHASRVNVGCATASQNYRKMSDGERMVATIAGAEGKRLMYE